MHLELNKDTKYQELFLGDIKTYLKKRNTLFSSKNIKEATAVSALAITAGATTRGAFNKIDLKGGVIGAVAVAGVLATKSIYTSITKDNKYMCILIGTKPNKEKTLIYNYVISNYQLNLKEVKKLAINKIKESL